MSGASPSTVPRVCLSGLSRFVRTLPWSPTREPTRQPSTVSSTSRRGSPWRAWRLHWLDSVIARRRSSTRCRLAMFFWVSRMQQWAKRVAKTNRRCVVCLHGPLDYTQSNACCACVCLARQRAKGCPCCWLGCAGTTQFATRLTQ